MILLPDLSHISIYAAYLSLACVMVWVGVRGGGPERACAVVLFLMLVLQVGLRNIAGHGQLLDHLDWPTLAADIFGTIALVAITLYADRVWIIRALTLQGLALFSHLLQTMAEMTGYTFVTLGIWPTMLIMPLMIIGTELHQFRLRRDGKDRDWVPLQKYEAIRKELDL